MSDDLFVTYEHTATRDLVQVTEENLIDVARAVGGTVTFHNAGPVLSIHGYSKKVGDYLDRSGTAWSIDGWTKREEVVDGE